MPRTELMKIRLEDETVIVVEVDRAELPSEVVLASPEPGKAIAEAAETLDAALGRIGSVINAIVTKLRSAENAPDTLGIEFGFKLGGEVGIILAKGTAETTFKVSVSWTKPTDAPPRHEAPTRS
jgi:hypothetical protein